ncbi:MAG: hypothetical protein KH135_05985 [Firmicutes bacterium]|nr:hypothetical protein [Bacillota bacterium]
MYSDYYLSDEHAVLRLAKEWREHKKIIIALDFDNTVYDFHHEGHTYADIFELLRACKEYGCYIVLFAARGDNENEFMTNYLKEHGIEIDGINENLPVVPFQTRKIYYNILLDDRAGLLSAYCTLKEALRIVSKDS